MSDKFLTEEEVYKFECDLLEGKYEFWINKYPEHVLSIFGAYLRYCERDFTESDIYFFKSKGVDLNRQVESIGTTPLNYACGYRCKDLMLALIQQDSDVNLKDNSGFTPLEVVLTGQCNFDLIRTEEVEECVKLLLNYGAKLEMREWVKDVCDKDYIENSKYLTDFFNERVEIM